VHKNMINRACKALSGKTGLSPERLAEVWFEIKNSLLEEGAVVEEDSFYEDLMLKFKEAIGLSTIEVEALKPTLAILRNEGNILNSVRELEE